MDRYSISQKTICGFNNDKKQLIYWIKLQSEMVQQKMCFLYLLNNFNIQR